MDVKSWIAIVANFITFLGPLTMTLLLFAVGLTQFDTLAGARTVGAAGTRGQEQQRILTPLATLRSSCTISMRSPAASTVPA